VGLIIESMALCSLVSFLLSLLACAPTPLPPCPSCYGYSAEDVGLIIESMASQGKEATFMGTDTPLPVLSARPHLLFNYFKQRFAQVRAGMKESTAIRN